MLNILLIGLALLAFIAIAVEDIIHINKAKSTLFIGTLSWLLLFLSGGNDPQIREAFSENILDIASLWLFLFAAMTFVAYLNQHGMVEGIVYRLLPANMPQKILLPFVAVFAFVFSSFCDNITTTLVTVALIHTLKLSVDKNIKLAVLAVFSINSGGAALITGDVTTLMIFTAGKVGIADLFSLIIPGLTGCLVLAGLLMPGFDGQLVLARSVDQASSFDKTVALIFILTIIGTLLINLFISVPPLLIFMFGLSLVFLLAHLMRAEEELPILEYIRKIEFDTLLFFLGVLLIVGMLKEIGTLDLITSLYSQFAPTLANFLIGCFSAVIDNVPLTAAVLKSDLTMPLNDWLGFTYTVGVGGSLLAIGSAAGVLVMSKVPGVTFLSYLRYTPQLLVSFTLGYGMIIFL